jgi:DNA-binding NarL/FixJ family response regulator
VTSGLILFALLRYRIEKQGLSHDDITDLRLQRIAESAHLTRREKDVFHLLAIGHGRQYICERLVVSEGTARTHIKHIYRKLDVHSKEKLLKLIHEEL